MSATPITQEEVAAMLDEQAIVQQDEAVTELEAVHDAAQTAVDEAIVIDFKMFEDEANEMKKKLDRFSVT